MCESTHQQPPPTYLVSSISATIGILTITVNHSRAHAVHFLLDSASYCGAIVRADTTPAATVLINNAMEGSTPLTNTTAVSMPIKARVLHGTTQNYSSSKENTQILCINMSTKHTSKQQQSTACVSLKTIPARCYVRCSAKLKQLHSQAIHQFPCRRRVRSLCVLSTLLVHLYCVLHTYCFHLDTCIASTWTHVLLPLGKDLGKRFRLGIRHPHHHHPGQPAWQSSTWSVVLWR